LGPVLAAGAGRGEGGGGGVRVGLAGPFRVGGGSPAGRPGSGEGSGGGGRRGGGAVVVGRPGAHPVHEPLPGLVVAGVEAEAGGSAALVELDDLLRPPVRGGPQVEQRLAVVARDVLRLAVVAAVEELLEGGDRGFGGEGGAFGLEPAE